MVAWMNSPGHRANILNGEFLEVGVGVVQGTPTGNANGATYANHFGAREGGGAGHAADTETVAEELPPLKRRVKRCRTVKLKGKAARVAKRAKRKTTKRVCKYYRLRWPAHHVTSSLASRRHRCRHRPLRDVPSGRR